LNYYFLKFFYIIVIDGGGGGWLNFFLFLFDFFNFIPQ
jgi:hypothetical protein